MGIPVIKLSPTECSERYAGGWRYAEWWLAKGGPLVADPSPNWSEERANGFCDRLAVERRSRKQGAAAGLGFFVDAAGLRRRTDDPAFRDRLEVDLSAEVVMVLEGEEAAHTSSFECISCADSVHESAEVVCRT